jgi:DNA-binding CsgD family transcriptional regulator
MQLIDVAAVPAQPLDGGAGESALAGLIGTIGGDRFGEEGLAQLNRWMPLCWWSIYRLFDDAPPAPHAMASFGVPDGTRRSWRVYRASLYRHDQTFHAAREFLRHRRLGLMHWHATEIPSRHRAEIYSRNGLLERLSIVAQDAGSLLAINFYRHETQRGFSDAEIQTMRQFSRPLLACVDRHIAWRRSEPGPDVFADLTPREREVCERLLKGWTHVGIAADLRVSPATVKTYRDRAFERLGIHHRNELFALAIRLNAG